MSSLAFTLSDAVVKEITGGVKERSSLYSSSRNRGGRYMQNTEHIEGVEYGGVYTTTVYVMVDIVKESGRDQWPNSWTSLGQKSFPSCYSQSPLITDFPLPPPLSKSGLKLVCNVNIVNGKFKFENSQDYAQKPQQNFTFMNSASGLILPS